MSKPNSKKKLLNISKMLNSFLVDYGLISVKSQKLSFKGLLIVITLLASSLTSINNYHFKGNCKVIVELNGN